MNTRSQAAQLAGLGVEGRGTKDVRERKRCIEKGVWEVGQRERKGARKGAWFFQKGVRKCNLLDGRWMTLMVLTIS